MSKKVKKIYIVLGLLFIMSIVLLPKFFGTVKYVGNENNLDVLE